MLVPSCESNHPVPSLTPVPARSSTLNFQLSTVNFFLKKMSGRWGDRPLGRGGWRVLQPEASSQLPPIPLLSRAAERFTGAIRPKPSCSGSRNQLPITVTILPSAHFPVDSPTGSFFSVLPTTLPGLFLVPTYLSWPFVAFLPHLKLLKMSRRINRRSLIKIRGPLNTREERVPANQCSENAEADASSKN